MADTESKDLDLDELHDAVNALMDQAQKGQTARPSRQPGPLAPKASKTPPADGTDLAPASVDTSSAGSAVPVAVRRSLPALSTHRGPRGMAMDVVGPRPVAPLTPPSVQTKRQAPTLQPTGPVTPEPVKPVSAPAVEPEASKEPDDAVLASINMKESAPQPALAHPKNEWPDPLEFHGFEDKPKSSPTEALADAKPEPASEPPTVVPAEEPKDAAADPLLAEDDADKSEAAPDSPSPFVTTKVEKRPLGAYAPAVEPSAPAPTEVAVEPASPAPQPSKTEAPAVSRPSELSPEVVAVESAEPEFRPNTPMPEGKDLDELRNMAIPQQYKEADKSASTEARPVFDTKEYHPAIEGHPAAAPHRSKVGASIMWIVLILLLLVAAGVAYYIITGGLDLSSLLPR